MEKQKGTRDSATNWPKILAHPQNPVVDIVFVHGLNGHREDTWRHPSASVPWPQAFLPDSIPDARIMTYGYDSKVADWSSFLGKVSVYGVQQQSHTLLETLASHRQGQESAQRAIIFVCHSLGGIVCKDALICSHKWAATEEHVEPICRATRGIIFLGTPHGGAQIANYSKILAGVVGLVKQTNRANLRELSKGSSKLESIQDDFDHHLRFRIKNNLPPVDVKCFYEAKPITGIGIVVDHTSAVLPGNIPIAINEDHRGMTRFRSTEDSGYILVSYHISRIVAKLRESINQPFGLGILDNMEHETSPQRTSLPTDHEGPGIPFRDAATPLSTDSLSTSSSGSSFVKIPPGGRFILNETVVPLPFDYVPPVLRNRQKTVFQSREDELSLIDAALHPNSLQINHLGNTTHKTCTITGLGGVGKTELAYRYLTRSKEKGDFDACFFIAADTPSRLREQYSRLALNLGLVSEIDQKDSETSAEIFRMWLAEPVKGIPDADKPQSMVRWLLVFDNAKDTDTLQQYIPHGTSGKIIVSRNPLFASNQFQVSSAIRLEPLPSADAVKLLKY